MLTRKLTLILLSVSALVIFNSGCGPLKPMGQFYDNFTSYYNTFYNVKMKFDEAERTRSKNIREHHNSTTEPTVPIATYQSVIESGASLLEYYPDCRWIDDTLLLMGIAYFRLGEDGRAERKFNELITIFPESEHLSSAYIWRARVIAKQGRLEEAETSLFAALPRIKHAKDLAEANLTLAGFSESKRQWSDAGDYYEKAIVGIRNKDDRSNAYYALGNALLNQGEFERAQEALLTTIKRSRNTRQVFDASILWSRCAIRLGDFEGAEQQLLKLRRDPEFETLISAIDVEIAALAVATNQIDRGIDLYQEFINQSENSEEKGIAYFRLGEIYRDYKVDLITAQGKFDSVNSSGAARSLIDSAKTSSDGLSRGLLSLARIKGLQDSILSFESESDSLQKIDWSQVMLVPEVDTVQIAAEEAVDTDFDQPVVNGETESVSTDTLFADTDTMLASEIDGEDDSLNVAAVDDTMIVEKKLSPAALLADSIMHAMKLERETQSSDTLVGDSILVEKIEADEDTISVQERRARERVHYLDSTVVVLKQNLMSTYLQASEFFHQELNEPDSSMKYLELAATYPIQHEDYWKAVLQLAARLKESQTADEDRIHDLYLSALSAESMPLSVQNSVRKKLGYELLSMEVPLQEQMLMDAEAAFMADPVSLDSTLELYRNVVRYDSTSPEGLQALFAIEYIYEYRLLDYESAKQATQAIIDLFPDSNFVSKLNDKFKEPSSGSIFNMTDEDIAAVRAQSHDVLTAQPDSTGWPPAEETLEGRRYR